MEKVERSPVAAARLGELYMILTDVFLVADKAYKPGWSDERIAKETGLSVEFVAKRRLEDYGPIIVDTAIPDLCVSIDKMLVAAEALGRAFGVFGDHLKTLAAAANDARVQAEKLKAKPRNAP